VLVKNESVLNLDSAGFIGSIHIITYGLKKRLKIGIPGYFRYQHEIFDQYIEKAEEFLYGKISISKIDESCVLKTETH
jgi:hypothetical protein